MLEVLRGTLLDKGKEVVLDKGKEILTERGTKFVRNRMLHLDEKEQREHLEQALKNAVERGLIPFGSSLTERDSYRDVLANLFEPGEHSKALQQEALQLFSFSEQPDFSKLNDAYNRSLQSRNLSRKSKPKQVDTTPYLTSFFNALIAELYADPYFKQLMSDAIQIRAAVATIKMYQSVLEIVQLLRAMNETLSGNYSLEQLEQDLQAYVSHLERTLRYLKIAGVVPTKDRSDKHINPEIHGIFVPLRVELKEQEQRRPIRQRTVTTIDDEESEEDETSEASVESDEVKLALEQCPYLVLLGGPGSGKSTIIKYMAWSHAAVHCTDIDIAHTSLLARRPFPLRIELRRLVEDRRRHEYDFLSYASEVILKREGVEVHPQMFKELLARKAMVLLFDGLDEVATLDERRRLVEEIEGFALRHPGNYVLVTSRPVGYELAPISSQWFAQAQVQEFDDAQIRQFLEHWYAHVLRLSPLPSEDRQELEALYKTLQDNPRLHKLAVNPLLLTVITALHRYERLPDKRILVYDRCADLLLDTWAKRKGTDVRW
jgi:hypothetical protein